MRGAGDIGGLLRAALQLWEDGPDRLKVLGWDGSGDAEIYMALS